jgi:PAS domain S-box-containing protein
MDAELDIRSELVREIDALKRQMRDGGEKYRALATTLAGADGAGIAYFSMDGRIAEANKAFLDMLGYTIEEARALSYQQLTPEPWRLNEKTVLEKQVMKRGFSDPYSKEFAGKNKSKCAVTVQTWLVRDEQECPWRLLVISRQSRK